MKHEIELSELQSFINEESFTMASSHGKISNKQLKCRLRGGYEVWNKKVLILETMQQNDAVLKYNSLP